MTRIAHLSDLQPGSGKRRRRIHRIWALQRLLADVNAQRPDHVVVTGDLADLSRPSEFASVRALLSELSLPPSEITVVPGDHDAYVPSGGSPRSFVEALAPYRTGDDGKAGVFPFVRARAGLAVIGFSMAVPKPLDHRLRSLETLLASPAVAGRFRIVALSERGRFLRVVARAGCELVLSPIGCPGARYRLYEIENGKLVSAVTRVLDLETGAARAALEIG